MRALLAKTLPVLALMLAATGPLRAEPITITFDEIPVGMIPGGTLTLNVGGIEVTFSGLGLQIRQFGAPFPSTRVLSTLTDIQPITVTFGGGITADLVEVENLINGRFTSEIDVIRGDAFDPSNVLLDSASNSNTIHRLVGPDIARVVYDDVAGPHGNGYVLDNFTFTPVPEPTSIALLGLGVCGALGYGWRRRAFRNTPW